MAFIKRFLPVLGQKMELNSCNTFTSQITKTCEKLQFQKSKMQKKIALIFGILSHTNVVLGRYSCATVKSLAGFRRKKNKTSL